LTAARWQVLGAVALAGKALTVPQIARRMGLTRQAVQESVSRLVADVLVTTDENPDHRRSPLICLTKLGAERYAALDRRQIRWINELATGLNVISTQLHRGIAGSSTFMNVAVWESARALAKACGSPEFQDRVARYPDSAGRYPALVWTDRRPRHLRGVAALILSINCPSRAADSARMPE
jgi:DNA-binding MarR family transcriptional regulator